MGMKRRVSCTLVVTLLNSCWGQRTASVQRIGNTNVHKITSRLVTNRSELLSKSAVNPIWRGDTGG